MEHKFNKFITFELSQEETRIGSMFHPIQVAVMQNRRAKIAEEILMLPFDPINPQVYGLKKAELQGSLTELDYLLEVSHKYHQEMPQQENPTS